jgi:hypothetical protein
MPIIVRSRELVFWYEEHVTGNVKLVVRKVTREGFVNCDNCWVAVLIVVAVFRKR